MRNLLLSLRCGSKRGIAFTLDSIIAVIVIFIVLGASSNYSSKSENALPDVQISRTGSDIVTLLENTGSLDSLNPTSIQNDLDDVLPPAYGINITIICSDSDLNPTHNLGIGEVIPEKQFVGTGKRFFIVKDGNMDFCMVKYGVWKK